MYIFKIIKSDDSSIEEFESAVYCARGCVESVLDNEKLSVKVIDNQIVIEVSDDNEVIGMTFSECKEKVKGCFGDASGKTYPEFIKIVPQDGK